MLRFIYLVITQIFLIIYYIIKMRHYANHLERYNEEQCFKLALQVIEKIKKKGRITTEVFGREYLPKEGGYIMYSNHQGKYDALGIVGAHPTPCAVVMDFERAKLPLCDQFMDMTRGKRLDKSDPRQQVQIIMEIVKELKEGRRYLLFPEGGYENNKNELQEFHAGSFKCAQKAKCPIVPVAIWDSYKPFGENSLKKVVTQVHFLEAIHFEDYAGKSTAEIRDLVKEKIEERMKQIAEQSREACTS